jgi:hypothetical protein
MTKHPAPKKKKKLRGQSSVEYILIIAAVVGVIMMFGKEFKTQLGGLTTKLFGDVNKGVSGLTGQ